MPDNNGGAILFIFFAFIIVAIAIRIAAGFADHDRIRHYIRKRRGQVLSIHWSPFGPGWFGNKGPRIYHVRYQDADGRTHDAACKTSLFSGVYFTQDDITPARHPADDPTPPT
jgi:hypothetical protein